MKHYKDKTVFEESLNRIRFIFDEFPNVVVSFSGGKDSTVVLNLALIVAREKNRLPLKVMFIDQEAEWQSTINHVEYVMNLKEVEPWWFQMPLKISNTTSERQCWLYCWDEKDKADWIHEKSPISIKENKYGTDRFHKLFIRILETEFPNEKACTLSGVRTDESPSRFLGLTSYRTYKYITYGKIQNREKEQYSFYPIYDWCFTDVWKAIYENDWKYNKIYDYMHMHGFNHRDMRVSNLHHETAINVLFHLQEIEPKVWNKITKRLRGINTAGIIGKKDFFVSKLPFMFSSWVEYRDYLLENLVNDENIKSIFLRHFKRMERTYGEMHHKDKMYKIQVNAIISNDYESVRLHNFEDNPEIRTYRTWKSGKSAQIKKDFSKNKYIYG